MPAKPITPPFNDSPALASFHDHLSHSRRIVAVLGAGLSAASGLPTFRGNRMCVGRDISGRRGYRARALIARLDGLLGVIARRRFGTM